MSLDNIERTDHQPTTEQKSPTNELNLCREWNKLTLTTPSTHDNEGRGNGLHNYLKGAAVDWKRGCACKCGKSLLGALCRFGQLQIVCIV